MQQYPPPGYDPGSYYQVPPADPRQLYAAGQQPQFAPNVPGGGQQQQQQGQPIGWVPASGGNPPPNAIAGGKEPDGHPLYIGRAHHANGLHPGKYAPHLHGLNFSYGGSELTHTTYDALVGSDAAVFWLPVRHGNLDGVAFGGFECVQ
ncbi:hypothetical protein HK104_006967, partial [Borealophlyctis nickersoniae]